MRRIYSYIGTVAGLRQEITRFQPIVPPVAKYHFYVGCLLMASFGGLIAVALAHRI